MSNLEYLPSVREQQELSTWLEYNRNYNWPDLPSQSKVLVHKVVENNGNITQASKVVGIGRSRAARILQDPLVGAYRDDMEAELRRDSLISRHWLELESIDLYEKMIGEQDIPMVTRDGDQIIAKSFNPSGANAAMKTLMVLGGVSTAEGAGTDKGAVNVQINMGDFTGETPEVKIVSPTPE